jgi:DNA primase
VPPNDVASEIKHALSDTREVLSKLGMLDDRRSYEKQPRGFIVRCPAHAERTPSCSVQTVNGVILWNCHACSAGGDVLDLVASSLGLSVKSDFKTILTEAAEMAGLWEIVDELRSGKPKPERPRVQPRHFDPEPEKEYPPAEELDGFLSICVPAHEDAEVSDWLAARHLDASLVSSIGWMSLPVDATIPWWASYKRESWTRLGHRLIVPMRDIDGRVRSVRAGRICDGESPKRLPPGGYKASGLVMADDLGVATLNGTLRTERFVVVEGETDFATWATRRMRERTAVIGIINGSWCEALASRFPTGSTILIRTDHDHAGDRYASEIVNSLIHRCFLRRTRGVAYEQVEGRK